MPLSDRVSVEAADLTAKRQLVEDAALQTAIMLSLEDAGRLPATMAGEPGATATSARSVRRKPTPECAPHQYASCVQLLMSGHSHD